MNIDDLIIPDWPAPKGVKALSTTRVGGVSTGAWSSLNLGDRCGDSSENVRRNRQLLQSVLPAKPRWMRQVHGITVAGAGHDQPDPEADAAVSSKPCQVLPILTADCLPVLLCDQDGTCVGAAHAGWRGLSGGVIEATVSQMKAPVDRLIAWLGPAIGRKAYEVGDDVLEAFESFQGPVGTGLLKSFAPSGDRWMLHLAGAARIMLEGLGIQRVYGGDFCTYSEPDRFFSYRRDGDTGRMASLIWLASKE
ncbi:MAG TPA: peptidoglycan editing factor PgeF [Xanthomonadales bacterium]|nr:peptidoglycan editing factor PgeF [Xanthomonadales bacterium]